MKIIVAVVSFLVLSFSGAFALETSMRAPASAAIKSSDYLQDVAEKSRLRNLRMTESYKRIYGICSKPFNFDVVDYFGESYEELIHIIDQPQKTVENFSNKKYLISRQLIRDLESEGFSQATKDCGYDYPATQRLIIASLAADASGKLAGGVSVLFLARVLKKAMGGIRDRSPGFYKVAVYGGVMSSIYFLYDYFKEKYFTNNEVLESDGDEGALIVTSVGDVERAFQLKASKEELGEIAKILLEDIGAKIENGYLQLQSQVLSPENEAALRDQLKQLEVKYDAIYQTVTR